MRVHLEVSWALGFQGSGHGPGATWHLITKLTSSKGPQALSTPATSKGKTEDYATDCCHRQELFSPNNWARQMRTDGRDAAFPTMRTAWVHKTTTSLRPSRILEFWWQTPTSKGIILQMVFRWLNYSASAMCSSHHLASWLVFTSKQQKHWGQTTGLSRMKWDAGFCFFFFFKYKTQNLFVFLEITHGACSVSSTNL